jgi:tRNA(fMet)-specific endonuclease VapC
VKYLLDFGSCVAATSGLWPRIAKRILLRAPGEVGLSSLSLASLARAAGEGRSPGRSRVALLEFLSPLAVLDFDAASALARAELASAGGELLFPGVELDEGDLLLAAQAVAHRLVLVTTKIEAFPRIRGLKTADWRAESLRRQAASP